MVIHSDNYSLFEKIVEYLKLQSRLLSHVKKEFGTIIQDENQSFKIENLKDLPPSIFFSGEKWLLNPHGAGILFKSVTADVKIDVHSMLDEEDIFDEWRLYTYLKSINFPLIVNQKKRKNFTSDELKHELMRLKESNVIFEVEGNPKYLRIDRES